jgi:serine/threonine-protein kinase
MPHKDPAARWQDARDLARELASALAGSHTTATAAAAAQPARRKRLTTIAAATLAILATIGVSTVVWRHATSREARSLVVLPCRAIGGDQQTQAYCDGLAETLSAKLMPLTASHRLQMTSTLEVREQHVANAADAHRQFGATLVLEGSVFRSGDTLRVNYVIVDAVRATQVDAYSTTASASDPFTLQDRVAQWAVSSLALQLNQPEQQALTAHGTSMPDAYEFYLQGRGYLLDPETPARVDAAIQLFERALERDSRFALAHAGAGRAYWLKYEATKDPAWVDRGRRACEQSVRLDPGLSEAYLCLGALKDGAGEYRAAAEQFRRALDREPTSDEAYRRLARAEEHLGDFSAAEQTYKQAIALRPQYWAGHTWLATFYRDRGRYAEAADEYRQAVLLTPDNPKAYSDLGQPYVLIGRYPEAIEAFSRSIALSPTFSAYANIGITYFRMRRFDDAISAFERAQTLRPGDYRGVGSLARAYYWKGDRARARELYARASELVRSDLNVNPRDVDAHIVLADYQAKLGHREQALDELARAGDVSDNPHRLLFEAFVHNQLGDHDSALRALEQAASGGLPHAELRAWADLDDLRNEPRLRALLDEK